MKVLHKVDIDNDGQLSKNELVKHIHRALYAMDEEEAEDEFIDADIDGDDRGKFSEILTLIRGFGTITERVFWKKDPNRSLVTSQLELRK